MEENIAEITNDLNQAEIEMGEIRAYSEAKKEKIREEERAERLAATKSSEEAKEAGRLQRPTYKEEEKAERTRMEAR